MSYLKMLSDRNEDDYFRKQADYLEFELREIEEQIVYITFHKPDYSFASFMRLLKERDQFLAELRAITPLLTDTYHQVINDSNGL